MMLFAFGSSQYGAFAKDQLSPLNGMNFSNSKDVYSKDGVLQTTIIAEYLMGNVGNQSVTSMTYNGSLGGPTLHVYPGDRIEIEFINNLNETTNLHFHGLHVSPSNNSDNVFLKVALGKTQQYNVSIPKSQVPGIEWYHSHMHSLAYDQVNAGLSGLIVVEGLEKLLPKPLQNITHQTFAMRDFPPTSDPTAPTYRTVNGKVNPEVNIAPGETQLWRFANIGAESFFKVELPGHKFHVIAEDGDPVWKVWDNDTILLPSGKRYDVLVTEPLQGNNSGALKSLAYYPYPETTLATVKVQGNQKEPAKTIPTSLIPKKDLNLKNISNNRTLTFASNEEELRYTINNKTFDPNRIDQKVKLGTVEQWRLINYDEDEHPFHIHVNDFQIVSINGIPHDAHGLQDMVLIPSHGELTIRIPFDDFVGKSVYHCHIMFHEDHGMMGVFEIVK